MTNMMRQYLGDEYNQDSKVQNYLRYVLKGLKTKPVSLGKELSAEECEAFDAWRRENDLDCLYFGGDLKADTLMSAWTPIKWVLECLNGRRFKKPQFNDALSRRDFEEILEDTEKYLPKDNDLVRHLEYFLRLAEEKCNYILLPAREMNCARYSMNVGGRKLSLFDEVPATLWHVFNPETLGRFFTDEDGKYDKDKATAWIREQHLTMGFEHGIVEQAKVKPLIRNLAPAGAKWLYDESEIRQALVYMIRFLEQRDNETDLMVSMYTRPKQSELKVNADGSIEEPDDMQKWGLFKDGVIRRITGGDEGLGNIIYAWENRLDKFDVYMRFKGDYDYELKAEPPIDAMVKIAENLRCTKKYGFDWCWFVEPPKDEELLSGDAYDLTDLIYLGDGIQVFILDRNSIFKCCTIDLGMKRYLQVSHDVLLIIVRDGEVNITRIYTKEKKPVKLADVLKNMGFEHKVSVSLYLGATKPLGAGWKVSLDKKYAVFSRFGYALERRFWSNSGDVWNTDFELHLMGPNWLRIDGHDVTTITVNNVSDDVLSEAEGLIEAVLTEPYNLTGSELVQTLNSAGVGHLLDVMRFVEEKKGGN